MKQSSIIEALRPLRREATSPAALLSFFTLESRMGSNNSELSERYDMVRATDSERRFRLVDFMRYRVETLDWLLCQP